VIITQTPLRISFFGGGTDFREFLEYEDGCVLSSAIDRYIFVIIKERFDDKIRVGYSTTELVDSVDDLRHELVRECLRKTGIRNRIEIATMGDIPSEGSGMGSSSTVTVGLLNAMYQYLGEPKDPQTLAREACEIEIDILRKPIGMQDQYIAAFGGQRFISFMRDRDTLIESLPLDSESCYRLSQHLMLFFTNVTRKAEDVLAEQVRTVTDKIGVLRTMKELAKQARYALACGALDDFGALLDDTWRLKRQLARGISNSAIDDMYDAAKAAGALGGKITGAGGGGFLLLYCRPDRRDDVRQALRDLPELPFNLERAGTKVIFDYSRAGRRAISPPLWTKVQSAAAGAFPH
jgi:D-glycero-alpha-D-manno-heptose-7-phosphate kinase